MLNTKHVSPSAEANSQTLTSLHFGVRLARSAATASSESCASMRLSRPKHVLQYWASGSVPTRFGIQRQWNCFAMAAAARSLPCGSGMNRLKPRNDICTQTCRLRKRRWIEPVRMMCRRGFISLQMDCWHSLKQCNYADKLHSALQ